MAVLSVNMGAGFMLVVMRARVRMAMDAEPVAMKVADERVVRRECHATTP